MSRKSLHSILAAALAVTSFGYPLAARAENGVTPNSILVGSSNPLTGSSAERGAQFIDGANLYLQSLNEKGGINGRKLTMKVSDDAYDPKTTVENTKAFIEKDKVFALFLYFGTQGPQAVVPMLEKTDVPMIFPTSAATSLRFPVNKNIFTVKANAGDEAEIFMALAAKRGVKDIGYFFQSDAMGAAGKQALQGALDKRGLKRKAEGSYVRNTVEVDQAIKELKAANPGAVVMSSMAPASVAFIKRSVEQGFKPIFMVYSSAAEPSFFKGLEGVQAEIYLAQALPYVSTQPLSIVADYKKAHGAKANSVSFEGYLNTAVFAHALMAAGPDLTRAKLRSSLESMDNVDIGGIKISFSPKNHQGAVGASVVKIENGVPVPFTP